MGCSASSTGASSPSRRYEGVSHANAKSLPSPAVIPDGGCNDYEAAYVNQMLMLASVLGDYERGRYDVRQARNLADQYMKSCGEISTYGPIDKQRTQVLMERRGVSEHVRRHLERLFKEVMDRTQDFEVKPNEWSTQLVEQAMSARQGPVGNGAANEIALQYRPSPTLLSSPGPQYPQQQLAPHSPENPQTAGPNGWKVDNEDIKTEVRTITTQYRVRHESREYKGVWDWLTEGGLQDFFNLDDGRTTESDGWRAQNKENQYPGITITTSRVRTDRREWGDHQEF